MNATWRRRRRHESATTEEEEIQWALGRQLAAVVIILGC